MSIIGVYNMGRAVLAGRESIASEDREVPEGKEALEGREAPGSKEALGGKKAPGSKEVLEGKKAPGKIGRASCRERVFRAV